MKRFFRFILYSILSIVGIVILLLIGFNVYFFAINTSAKASLSQKQVLKDDGHTFRDLNKNGKLDIYEDSRASVEERTEDLISQMNTEEKAGMLFIQMMIMGEEGELNEIPSLSNPFSLMRKRKEKPSIPPDP